MDPHDHTDDDWMADAACNGVDPDVFFRPDHDLDGPPWSPIPAYRICASCPVVTRCLEENARRADRYGIWGGAGGDLKRLFTRANLLRTHPGYRPGCTCGWCAAVTDHLGWLTQWADGAPVELRRRHRDRNGANVTHGRASTYVRGCRCSRCVFRMSVCGVALRWCGVDVAEWWPARWGPSHGLGVEPETVAAQVTRAKQVVAAGVAAVLATVELPATVPGIDADHLAMLRGYRHGDPVERMPKPADLKALSDVTGIDPALWVSMQPAERGAAA